MIINRRDHRVLSIEDFAALEHDYYRSPRSAEIDDDDEVRKESMPLGKSKREIKDEYRAGTTFEENQKSEDQQGAILPKFLKTAWSLIWKSLCILSFLTLLFMAADYSLNLCRLAINNTQYVHSKNSFVSEIKGLFEQANGNRKVLISLQEIIEPLSYMDLLTELGNQTATIRNEYHNLLEILDDARTDVQKCSIPHSYSAARDILHFQAELKTKAITLRDQFDSKPKAEVLKLKDKMEESVKHLEERILVDNMQMKRWYQLPYETPMEIYKPMYESFYQESILDKATQLYAKLVEFREQMIVLDNSADTWYAKVVAGQTKLNEKPRKRQDGFFRTVPKNTDGLLQRTAYNHAKQFVTKNIHLAVKASEAIKALQISTKRLLDKLNVQGKALDDGSKLYLKVDRSASLKAQVKALREELARHAEKWERIIVAGREEKVA